jgi:hypothetical protein
MKMDLQQSRLFPQWEVERYVISKSSLSINHLFIAPYFHSSAIVQRFEQIELPNFARWPKFELIEKLNADLRVIEFQLLEVPPEMRSISLLVHCPNNRDCIHNNVNHGMILHNQPVYAPFSLNLTVAGAQIPIEIVFNWNIQSPQFSTFSALFPAYVRPQQKYRVLLDTSLLTVRALS